MQKLLNQIKKGNFLKMIKKVFKILVAIPWFPYDAILVAYALFRILKDNSFSDVVFCNSEDLKNNKGIREYFEIMTAPDWMKYTVAGLFYLWLVKELFK